jgi:hypothetical protein
MTGVHAALLAVCFTMCTASASYGQVYLRRESPRRGSVEVGGGGMWAPGFDLPSLDAQLSRAAQTDGFALFATDGKIRGFPGAHARVGLYVTSTLSVEGGLRYSQPSLSYDLSLDAESAEDETATETASHYVFDGSLLFHLTGASFAGRRGVPFVSIGAGYVRELHEGNELVVTGNEIHATAGVKYWFGSGSRRFGLRGEVGLSSRQKGLDAEEARRLLPLALAGVTFLF